LLDPALLKTLSQLKHRGTNAQQLEFRVVDHLKHFSAIMPHWANGLEREFRAIPVAKPFCS
jgi:hypothetical protein